MSELSPQQRIRCMSALVATMAVVSITSSLAWPILSEALRNQGYSESMIGINAAAQFAGIIVVALAAPRIIPAMGFFKTIVLGLVVVAVMLIALPAFRSFETWLLIRFLLGVGNSLLFTAGDTWMNHIVDDRVRGRWMGIYVTVGMAGWALGPLLGAYLDPDTYWPFVWGLLAIMVAAVFLLPTRKLDVKLSLSAQGVAMGLATVFIAAPTVLLSSAMFGVVEGAMQSFAHLYTMDILGAQFRQTGYAVIWVGAIAAVFFQYPIGWLADKVNRRWLLIACVLTMMVSIFLFPLLIEGGRGPWWEPRALGLWSVVSVWGGSMGGIFTVGITLLGQRFRDVELVSANAMFSVLFGVGGLLGPFLAGTAMSTIGPVGFPLSLLAVVAVYAVFALYRQFTRR
ncbi:MAG TPA: MFS transporter [Gammaproteobacteria bacterium]|nr:MFS transporter [Gammaproteobacteria bacterium]